MISVINRIVTNIILPKGITLWVEKYALESWPHLFVSCVHHSVHTVSERIFCRLQGKMDKVQKRNSDSACFELFSNNPKGVSVEIVKWVHKCIAKVIRDGQKGPTLIKIFDEFTQQKIKKYVFTLMTKPILLELALCIIQYTCWAGSKNCNLNWFEVTDPFDEKILQRATTRNSWRKLTRPLLIKGLWRQSTRCKSGHRPREQISVFSIWQRRFFPIK